MLRRLFLATLLILAGFGGMQAEDDGPEGVYLGPQIGFQKANDADEGRFWGGAVLRARLTYALALEGSINYRQEDFLNHSLTVRSWPVMASALFYPVSIIYGVAGMGWYNTTFDWDASTGVGDDTQQKVGWHFGGGLELPLSDNVNFMTDIRYVFLNYDLQEQGVPGTNDISSNFYVLNFGLLWDLGGSY